MPKDNGLKGKSVSRNGRFTHFAIVAAREAMKDSGIDLSSPTFDKDRFGCIVGSGIGGVEWFENVSSTKINSRRVVPIIAKKNFFCRRIVITLLLLVADTIVYVQ